MTDTARFEARVTRAVRKYRRELIGRDHEAQKRFALQLREAHQALLRELEAARQDVESARDRGVNENTFRLQRALDLAQQAEALLQQYAQNGTSYIAQQQREVAQTAYQAAREFIDTTNPPPPNFPNASSFMTFPQEALEVITAATSSGPVYELLNRYGADAAKAAGRVLTQAIVLGTHSDVVGRQLSNELAVPLWKGAQIARTEINRAYQESLRETWRENKHITPKWIWRSGRTSSTCAVCWAMDGTEHDVDEPMGSHPSCRCSMVPATVSWDDLAAQFGIEMPDGDFDPPREPTGPEAFDQLPESDQRAVLGSGKFKAYAAGEIRLEDLVTERQSEDWGVSRSEGSLRRAIELAEIRAGGSSSSGSAAPARSTEETVGETLNRVEQSIWRDTGESGFIVDPDTGEQVMKLSSGEKYRIELSDDDIRAMSGKIFTHNHPRGWEEPEGTLKRNGNSFSIPDLYTSILAEVAEMRAVTPTRIFSLRPGPDGWNPFRLQMPPLGQVGGPDEVADTLRRMDALVRQEQMQLILYGKLTTEQAENNHAHLVTKRLAERWGLDYRILPLTWEEA
jgi:hypothetical protein